MPSLKIAFASDHAGFPLKRLLMEEAQNSGHHVEDFGCRSEESVDLIDFAAPASEGLGKGKFDRGIFVDGAGYPSGIIANMHSGVFAAVCNDPVSARLAREHGGANALCLGAMVIGVAMAREIVKIFLDTDPLGGKYAKRRDDVAALGEKKRLGPLFRRREAITVEDLRQAILNKEPLILDERTVITPSVLDAVRNIRP